MVWEVYARFNDGAGRYSKVQKNTEYNTLKINYKCLVYR